MRLKLLSPPSIEPVSLAEAKLHARIEIPDDDALVSSLISAARRYAETQLRKALITQMWILYLDGFPTGGGYYNSDVRRLIMAGGGIPSDMIPMPGYLPNASGIIDLPMPPIQSVVSVSYRDLANVLQTVPSSSYNVSTGTPGRIQPVYGQYWPVTQPRIDAVQITYTAGESSIADGISENVKTAIKMCVSYWYEQRESVSDGGNNFAVVPMAVDALLSPDDPGTYA